jgi:hypothetical protein
MTEGELDNYMMIRANQLVAAIIDEVGIDHAGQWVECMLLSMLRLVDLPPHESSEYFKEMSKMYVAMRTMSDKRVLN